MKPISLRMISDAYHTHEFRVSIPSKDAQNCVLERFLTHLISNMAPLVYAYTNAPPPTPSSSPVSKHCTLYIAPTFYHHNMESQYPKDDEMDVYLP
ncbi:hypothetical protein CEXT_166711 [Caerostris extrusa]|uniref:Uncharacterized protein n=1 Tax=Caerostris extrusa TaxID=172846 RepID=A0AAV4SNE3_CAEEX|nr:hypothetical protein CEXT_166711 [Caerostris extrusa]